MLRPFAPLAKVRPRDDSLYVSQGRSVLATSQDGFLHDTKDHGFLCYETRLLSRYEMQINGKSPHPNVLSNIEQHTWLGYYTFIDESLVELEADDGGSGQMNNESEKTLELRVSRYVGGGMHEDIDFKNYTGKSIRFEFTITADADFADQKETTQKRKQHGKREVQWREEQGSFRLEFCYSNERHVQEQDFTGTGRVETGLTLLFHNYKTPPKRKKDKIIFSVELEPFGTWHSCVDFIPLIDGQTLKPQYDCHSFSKIKNDLDRRRHGFQEESMNAEDPSVPYLAPVVLSALEQARMDLASMRLHDLDTNEHRAWTMAAGLPLYTAFFGRDTLTTSWQAGLFGPEMMEGTLNVLTQSQGEKVVNWFDEEPGRMIHEMHSGPLAKLYFNNHARNYGSVTTAHLFPFMVSQLWHWTGDKELIESYIEPSLKALRWMKEYETTDEDGFLYYQTHSKDGVKNQGWKDSPSAVVDHEGKQVRPATAMSEEQGFAYLSKYFFSEVLWSLGRKDQAKALFAEAKELKKRFNDKFWMEDEGYFAMGLDNLGQPIRSIGSDPGHCIAAGLVDKALVPRMIDRMFKPDLFSGWGIRTLSTENPAYNPYSYHRGSVWPVENATFCMGLMRYGMFDQLETLSRAFFETASLYEFYRLPEVLSGHHRDEDHPIPAIYPKSNSPQAWSSSAVASVVQSILGIYPYAPMKTLVINPVLPEWLPQIQLNNIRVGQASVSIRFYRKPNGKSDYEITDQTGDLRVIRQPSPWSMTTGVGERLGDLVESILH